MFFFDPYLEYTTSESRFIQPIPVLITNYAADGIDNGESDEASWQYTRRFLLVENQLLPGSTLRKFLGSYSIYMYII